MCVDAILYTSNPQKCLHLFCNMRFMAFFHYRCWYYVGVHKCVAILCCSLCHLAVDTRMFYHWWGHDCDTSSCFGGNWFICKPRNKGKHASKRLSVIRNSFRNAICVGSKVLTKVFHWNFRLILKFRIICFQLVYISPTFYNLFGIHAEVARGTLTLWMQVTYTLFMLCLFTWLQILVLINPHGSN